MQTLINLAQRVPQDITGKITISGAELDSIDGEFSVIVEEIAKANSFADAQVHLDTLRRLQELLATLEFKYHQLLNPRLRLLVREFDRCDDANVRRRYFVEIKAGRRP